MGGPSPPQINWSKKTYEPAEKDYIGLSCKSNGLKEKVTDEKMNEKPENMLKFGAKSEFFESDFYELYHTDLKLKPEKIEVCHLEVNNETEVIDQWETRNQSEVCVSQLDNITKGLSSLKHIKKVDNLDREMTKNIECDEGPIKGGCPLLSPKSRGIAWRL